MPRTVRRSWVWNFPQPPNVVWPVLADTPQLNETIGAPRHQLEEIAQPDGTVRRIAHAVLRRIPLEWEERPYQWVLGRSFTQERRFHQGPFRRLGPSLDLTAEGTGSRAIYSLEAEAATWYGYLLLRLGFLERTGRTMERTARALLAAATTPTDTSVFPSPPRDPAQSLRVEGMVAALEASGNGHGLARRLADLVLRAPESELGRLRPLVLARSWAVPPRLAIETCLGAVKVGLLSMSWDVICPRCRGPKAAVASLDRLPKGSHCPSCNVPFDADFSQNVELTFHPAPAVRLVEPGGYCHSGPAVTPHIAVQQILAPGERRQIAFAGPPRPWRLRTFEPGTWTDIDNPAPDTGLPCVIAVPDGTRCCVKAGAPAPLGTVVFENRCDHELTMMIEDRAWASDALTAHHVTTLEAFRELFSDDVLRPGDEVAIGHVTLMFTDLKSSTALYSRVGDARAYHLVRSHFAFLTERIRSHDGAIVKTIGDAVMAAFADPGQAVAAARAIQRDIAAFNAPFGADPDLVIKLGLHTGPCVAVTLNGRLDYFGSTVNLAARLQGESRGGDIVISATLAADPAVAASLATIEAPMEQALVKGFAAPVAFRRLIA